MPRVQVARSHRVDNFVAVFVNDEANSIEFTAVDGDYVMIELNPQNMVHLREFLTSKCKVNFLEGEI